MKELGGWLVLLAFLVLLCFVFRPETFLFPTVAVEKHPGGEIESPGPSPAGASPETKDVTNPAPPASTDVLNALLDKGSGKEVPGEKLVRFPSKEAYQKFLATAPPGAVLGQIDVLNSVRVIAAPSLANVLAQFGGSVSGNFYVQIPEEPLEVREKGDSIYRAVGKRAVDLIGADGVVESWGQGVKVALIDTPVEEADKGPGEAVGHGTAMRSLIQGQTGPVRGAAPGAEVVAFAVLDHEGKGSSFSLAEAIVKAVDQGVRVINMSLGSDRDSPVVRDAVDYALRKNVVLVAAAGNEAVNQVSYPAAYEGVIGVASVDAAGSHLYFSNRGKAVDVAAPGFAVVASWPGQKFVEISGTSGSTALVSGVVAALMSQEPDLSGSKAAELIADYADDTGLPGRDDETGRGVVNLQRALERKRRGIVDVAVAGVTMKPDGRLGKITAAIQNRGTETVNSVVLEITVGEERRKFFLGSLAPGKTVAESLGFDLIRARQGGGVGAGAAVQIRGDQRTDNDLWTGYFRISKDK